MISLVLIFGAGSVYGISCNGNRPGNFNAQDYKSWAKTVESYMVECDGGYMTVQGVSANKGPVLIEYYDDNLIPTHSVSVTLDLPIWGAFYDDGECYYLLTGQENRQEDDEREVIRLTRYDKDWNEIDHDSIYGANTVKPFEAGSARITSCGDYLLIRTCHTMYMHTDGYNHQANVTLEYSCLTGEFTERFTHVSNSGYGYASHSFNQFIKVDDGRIVAVDHGDAHPRSIALFKYATDCSDGTFMPYYNSRCSVVDLIGIAGAEGDNTTGVSVGGLEIGADNYIVAGNSVDMEAGDLYDVRNIFVATVPRNVELNSDSQASVEPVVTQLTSYDKYSPTTPHLVKMSDSLFVVMWCHQGSLYYTCVDDSGNVLSDTNNIGKLSLSDCAPIVSKGKIWWYTVGGDYKHFYALDLKSGIKEYTVKFDHEWEVTMADEKNPMAEFRCSKCGEIRHEKTPVSFHTNWVANGRNYAGAPAKVLLKGTTLECWIDNIPEGTQNYDFEYLSSDPSVIKWVQGSGLEGNYSVLHQGTATLTIRAKYNPSVMKSFDVIVRSELNEWRPPATYIKTLTRRKACFTVEWRCKPSNATGYQIRYSTKSSMSGAKTITVTDATKARQNISNLKRNKRYYVQVRAYKKTAYKTYYSEWSKRKCVKMR